MLKKRLFDANQYIMELAKELHDWIDKSPHYDNK